MSLIRFAVIPFAIAPLLAFAAGDGCGSQAGVPADKRVVNTPHWTTASEEENFGYDVFRSSVGEKGPFEKLTKQPILGNGTTDETHEYKYPDDNIDPCKDYWYYVESIASNGTREKFTPVFRAPAKRGPGAAKVDQPKADKH
ncbi:MAG: hypothetical protein ABJB01_12475 [Rudaea sp.]